MSGSIAFRGLRALLLEAGRILLASRGKDGMHGGIVADNVCMVYV